MVMKRLVTASAPAVQRISSTKAFATVAPHFFPALDRTVHRLSGGRVMLSAAVLPSLVLTTTGARSGRPRPTPLACMPEDGGSFIVVGSNFGRPNHPAWTGNLLKHPEAEVSFHGRDIPVAGELLSGEDRASAWQAVLRLWPPYASYQARVERQIRLFRLRPR